MLGQSSLRQKEHSRCLCAIQGKSSVELPGSDDLLADIHLQTVEEAMEADARFHGTQISGRPCRIKYARAPRKLFSPSVRRLTDPRAGTIFVARRDQQPLFPPEAMHYLRPFGRMDYWWTPCVTERALYNLPAGAFFRFELFQPCQEALRVRLANFFGLSMSTLLTCLERLFAVTRLSPSRSHRWRSASLLSPPTTPSFLKSSLTPSTLVICLTTSTRTLCA